MGSVTSFIGAVVTVHSMCFESNKTPQHVSSIFLKLTCNAILQGYGQDHDLSCLLGL